MRTLKDIALERHGYLTEDTLRELATEYPNTTVVLKFELTHQRVVLDAINAFILLAQLKSNSDVKEVFIPADQFNQITK